jgi:hypothetical protein
MSLLRLRQDSSPAVVSAAWEMAPMMDLQGRLDGVLEAATLTRILLGVGILLLLALAVNSVGPRPWPLRWW